jgi:hypothetical protein
MQGQIDILKERAIPIKVFPAEVEVPGRDGNRVHWLTVGKWCTRGISGIVLESVVIGNQRCTTKEAYSRFVEAVTRAANGERLQQAIGGRSRRQRDAAVRRAVEELIAGRA